MALLHLVFTLATYFSHHDSSVACPIWHNNIQSEKPETLQMPLGSRSQSDRLSLTFRPFRLSTMAWFLARSRQIFLNPSELSSCLVSFSADLDILSGPIKPTVLSFTWCHQTPVEPRGIIMQGGKKLRKMYDSDLLLFIRAEKCNRKVNCLRSQT